MNLTERIRANLPELTTGERLAAEYILQYPFDAIRFGSATLADSAATSRSNVVRFCQKLGFNGYSDFKYELKQTLSGMPRSLPAEKEESGETTVLGKYLQGFKKMSTLYRSSQLKEIARLILSARQVLVLGKDHSALSAQQLAFRLGRTGVNAFPVDMPSNMVSFTDILTERDAAVILSIQGRRESYEEILRGYRARGAKLVLVTITKRAPVAALCDQVVVLPSVARDHSSDMLDDAPTYYLFIELLIEAVRDELAERDAREREETP